MYLHIGGNDMIRQEEIIGVFDIENSTVSEVTREYLKGNSKGCISVSHDLPKSFVVTEQGGICRIYFTNISSGTLKKRMEEGLETEKSGVGGTHGEESV